VATRKYRDNVIIRQRMLLIFGVLFLLFFVLTCRLAILMIKDSEALKNKAIAQWTNEIKIAGKRGKILDTNGNELAVSANVYRVDLDMNTIRQSVKSKVITNEELVTKLSTVLSMKPEDISKLINSTLPGGLPVSGVTLKRRIDKSMADNVNDLKIRGVLVSSDTQRYYNNNNFLAQVLGHTNTDGIGLTGLEKTYDKVLSGIPGKRVVEMDSKGAELPYTISQFTKPIDGKDIVLTVDEVIQQICEKAATQALNDNKAKAVSIIVMNPQNGEVLAMVNKPDYDPNNPWQGSNNTNDLNQIWRNRAVSDTFEPGSIFKVVTATAALSEGTVKDGDTFNCTGSFKVLNNTIHCWKTSGHGVQSFVQILENSCNVGFMQVGLKLGKDRLNKYINLFGFGKATGIDLPGEAKGIIKNPAKETDLDLATISFGQTNTVSCIQFLTAFNSIANGGKWIRPHLMKEVTHYDANGTQIVDQKYDNYGEKQIIDTQVAATLRGDLEKVVSEGGGKNAFIEGYHIGGKTGTAKKIVPSTGRYGDNMYISSFVGMAPVLPDKLPRFTVLVSIDQPDPSNYYAGQITAPVAKQIFNDLFNYLALIPDASQNDVAKSLLKDVVVPEVRGLKKDQAMKILRNQNLNYDIVNTGDYIVEISPKPGSTVKEGSKIILYSGSTSNYNKEVTVPDMSGYTKEKATTLLNEIGLKAIFNGDGIITEQSIPANSDVSKGTVLTFDMETLGD
jgi:stage V sporulation protein D (sporulation-specific penicillin-binding protein)